MPAPQARVNQLPSTKILPEPITGLTYFQRTRSPVYTNPDSVDAFVASAARAMLINQCAWAPTPRKGSQRFPQLIAQSVQVTYPDGSHETVKHQPSQRARQDQPKTTAVVVASQITLTVSIRSSKRVLETLSLETDLFINGPTVAVTPELCVHADDLALLLESLSFPGYYSEPHSRAISQRMAHNAIHAAQSANTPASPVL